MAPATLDQRGGSALTLEDRGDHFDAIVFGELAPGKWMAGSDMFSRTQRNQSAVPAETAGPGTFVQIAIAYRGGQVAIYRDGRLLAQYAMPTPPREFGPDSLVLFGRRHRRQGDSAHFGGRIADARIYDRALDAAELAALRMDAEPALAPWAWWTFDDPGGADRTGRFPNARLRGGARVEGGVLVLDGKDDSLLCTTGDEPPFVPETPAMPAELPPAWLTFHLAHPGPGRSAGGECSPSMLPRNEAAGQWAGNRLDRPPARPAEPAGAPVLISRGGGSGRPPAPESRTPGTVSPSAGPGILQRSQNPQGSKRNGHPSG